MKRLITFAFAMSCILYLSNVNLFAQGKGNGRGPAVTGSHSQDVNRGVGADHSADHGKSADHRNDADRDASKHTTDANHSSDFVTRMNPELRTRLTGMLPAGTTLANAAMGFKNQGQFIAALNVSKNLNIPFADLKAKMTGTNPESLGAAIHDLKPNITTDQAKTEAEKAEKAAKAIEKEKAKKPIS